MSYTESQWRKQKNEQTPTIQLQRTKNYYVVLIAEIEAELKKRKEQNNV